MKLIDSRQIIRAAMLGMLIILTAFFVVVVYRFSSVSPKEQVVINEICSNNFNLISDNNGRYLDYIELFNPGAETVLLEGCFLSDDENQLQKLSLDAVSIPPMGYYVIWLTGKADISDNQTGEFGISKFGETIFLSDSNSGKILDSVTVPELPYNICYGRVEDGAAEWAKMSDTAGRSNLEAEIFPSMVLKEPVISVESGFYEESFEVTITASEGDTIYYTLDGSNPATNSHVYQVPLVIEDASQKENIYAARKDLSPTRQYTPSFKVDKATILRAVSYNSQDNTISKVVTKVYFVGYGGKSEYDNLPVISIVTDPDNLFDEETGIYGNGVALEQYQADGGLQNGELLENFTDREGNERYLYMASNAFNDGREWEREAVLSYFDHSHEYEFEQNVGIRIAGQSTRATPQKSFNIYGREIYGQSAFFTHEFFPDTSYSTIKLRNGGNNNDSVMITDAFLEALAEGRHVSIQRSTPCVVFLNGEYWGIYNIRERYKEEFLNNHYGVRENNVWIIDGDVVRVGEDEAQTAYQYMIDVINECDLSYDDVYAMVCDIIDIQSLIDYCCINLYVGNKDVSFIQNTAVWRTAETEDKRYGDGKWRWMLFDMDVSLQRDSDVFWMKNDVLMNEPVITSLMENEQFRKQFCLTFMDIANTNYAYETVHETLMEWEEIYEEQVVKNHQRFFDENFSREEFVGYIAEIDDFFKYRFSFAMDSLAAAFGLKGELELVAVKNNDVEGGTVIVNTAKLDGLEEWTGRYFTDYPIVLEATPDEGYRFVGWSGDISSQENVVEIHLPKGGLRVEAVFEKVD